MPHSQLAQRHMAHAMSGRAAPTVTCWLLSALAYCSELPFVLEVKRSTAWQDAKGYAVGAWKVAGSDAGCTGCAPKQARSAAPIFLRSAVHFPLLSLVMAHRPGRWRHSGVHYDLHKATQ